MTWVESRAWDYANSQESFDRDLIESGYETGAEMMQELIFDWLKDNASEYLTQNDENSPVYLDVNDLLHNLEHFINY